MDEIRLRPARAGDYDAILALWEAADLPAKRTGRDARPEFVRQVAAFATTYIVAEHEGRLVGVVLGTHDLRKGWINRLAVDPAYRRRGLGLRLTAACEDALRALGIDIISALVEVGNDASAALLRRAGYVEDVPVHYFRKRSRPDI